MKGNLSLEESVRGYKIKKTVNKNLEIKYQNLNKKFKKKGEIERIEMCILEE